MTDVHFVEKAGSAKQFRATANSGRAVKTIDGEVLGASVISPEVRKRPI
jgi:hypothetical protein